MNLFNLSRDVLKAICLEKKKSHTDRGCCCLDMRTEIYVRQMSDRFLLLFVAVRTGVRTEAEVNE